jgi:hypothetical protein
VFRDLGHREYHGAFTYFAIKTLKNLPADASYAQWQQAIRNYLPSATYPQTPQILGDPAARRRKVFA